MVCEESGEVKETFTCGLGIGILLALREMGTLTELVVSGFL